MKRCVEELYRKNTDYKYPEQAINQAESLKALSSDLYSDNIRFIYELIQNADDSRAKNISLNVVQKGTLIIGHDGNPFDEKDLQGLCGVNNGTKKKDINKTGYKGLGFKAVFGKSNCTIIYSNGEYFRFDSSHKVPWNKLWGTEDQQTWENENDRKFIYPWQINPIWTQEMEISSMIRNFLQSRKQKIHVAYIILLEKIEEIRLVLDQLKQLPHMFLFLRHICNIDFIDDIIGINRNMADYSIKIDFNRQTVSEWIVKCFELEVPDSVRHILMEDSKVPEKLRSIKRTEIIFAANCKHTTTIRDTKTIDEYIIKQVADKQSHLFSYLPTKITDYTFPMLVNANFLTNANREQIHTDSSWNQWLFTEIGSKVFEWIKGLVIDEKFGVQAYNLIPSQLNRINNDLSTGYNQAHRRSIKECNFILNRKRQLFKVDQVIMDSTLLTKQTTFMNLNSMRNYVVDYYHHTAFDCADDPFIDYDENLSKIGVRSFRWQSCIEMFKSAIFLQTHSVKDNKQMIAYFYSRCSNESTDEHKLRDIIEQIPFIMDQNGELQGIKTIYFPRPTIGDGPTDDSDSCYVHKDVFTWLNTYRQNPIKEWLITHGVTERTDLTYLQKTILPNAATYVNKDNAIETVRTLFRLFQNKDINKEHLNQLGQLNVLTTKNNLLPAEQCFFSDKYRPRLSLEEHLEEVEDKFLSTQYLSVSPSVQGSNDVLEWHRFFLNIGVRDELYVVHYKERMEINQAIEKGFLRNFLTRPSPNGRRPADAYSGLKTISFLNRTIDNYRFAQLFWSHLIKNKNPDDFHQPSTRIFWRSNYGTEINDGQYITWFIKNMDCIPTTNQNCKKSTNVLIKTDQVIKLCGNYLPIVDILEPKSNTRWDSFFGFKRTLSMSDYFVLLKKIREDESNLQNNQNRIQKIYRHILDTCHSWSEEHMQIVKTQLPITYLLAENNQWKLTCDLFILMNAGSSKSSQQAVFPCVKLSKSNKMHEHIGKFLEIFNIKQIDIRNLKLSAVGSSPATSLYHKFIEIMPFFKNFLKFSSADENIISSIDDIFKQKIDFIESQSLQLLLEDKLVLKTHAFYDFTTQKFHVTKPWDSETTFTALPHELCQQVLKANGFEGELRFLLKADEREIEAYFRSNSIEIPVKKDRIALVIRQTPDNRLVSTVVEHTASSRTNTTINTSISTEPKRTNSGGILNIGRKRAYSPSTHLLQTARERARKKLRSEKLFTQKFSHDIHIIDLSFLYTPEAIPTADTLDESMDIGEENGEKNQRTGFLGERLVYQYLLYQYRDRLCDVTIKWINEEQEIWLPYDILLTDKEEKHYIEVKTTASVNEHKFFISIHQMKALLKYGDQYHIYRVYLSQRKLVILDDVLDRLEKKNGLALQMIIEQEKSFSCSV